MKQTPATTTKLVTTAEMMVVLLLDLEEFSSIGSLSTFPSTSETSESGKPPAGLDGLSPTLPGRRGFDGEEGDPWSLKLAWPNPDCASMVLSLLLLLPLLVLVLLLELTTLTELPGLLLDTPELTSGATFFVVSVDGGSCLGVCGLDGDDADDGEGAAGAVLTGLGTAGGTGDGLFGGESASPGRISILPSL
jgi:hypothetical protein